MQIEETQTGAYACPTCEKVFLDEGAVKTHHYQVHEESIATREVECDHCGATIERVDSAILPYNHHFCDKECWREATRYTGGTP